MTTEENAPPQSPTGHIASVMPPQVQQATPTFQATGSLQIPNAMTSADGMSASSFMNKILPLANKASSMTIAEQQIAANTPAAPKEQQ